MQEFVYTLIIPETRSENYAIMARHAPGETWIQVESILSDPGNDAMRKAMAEARYIESHERYREQAIFASKLIKWGDDAPMTDPNKIPIPA